MAKINSLTEAAKLIQKEAERRKLYTYRPFGHPDTICPNGILWKEKHEAGEWEQWSNKTWQLDFHNLGKDHAERMLVAANGVGKTIAGGVETAFHVTGEYPDWWEGKRFHKPVRVWVGSITNETQRDYTQPILLGPDLEQGLGTGFIPHKNIMEKPKTRQCGISGVADLIRVRHKSGGISKITFKVYEQGWPKWQGAAPEVIWMDELPDENNSKQGWIFTEAQTRVFRSSGILYVTATPLYGVTEITRHFMEPKHQSIAWVGATWDDVPHLKEADKERLRQTYPKWQIETRTRGVPMMGHGRIFTEDEENIRIEPFEIPAHFARIIGLDFGLDHPQATAVCAWDRDRDIFYVTDVYRRNESDPVYHSQATKARGGDWIPCAWPHDGANRDKANSGYRLKDQYKAHGLMMLSRSARYKNDVAGSQPQWPIIHEIQERCHTDRFKVFSTCSEFFEEYRNYHTNEKGQIVSNRDDVLKATFYALMMKRFAQPKFRGTKRQLSAPILSTRV